ncbi:MAG: BON domain-containing protein [Chloroflexota bacterium]|nr:BON domain-containing protein [Chloroflexota bacterium]
MTDAADIAVRPDMDIHKQITSIITQYPPTASDRFYIITSVQDGVVVLSGHVKTPINRRYLINEIPKVPGVRALDSSSLFDDETIRIEAGRRLPQGVMANVRYGTVALSGEVPAGTDLDVIAAAVSAVPGVLRVVANG